MSDIPADVLVVEDNLHDVGLVMQAFQRYNLPHRIEVVRDGPEALDFLHHTGRFRDRPAEEIPKLILLDLNIPLVDGHYVLRQIASDARTRIIPVVVLTSSQEPRDIFSAYQLGISSYVVKPVNSDTFIETVGKTATYWLSINHSPVI
ncbi:MAG: response regulator [Nitrospiraceae bacterium]